jgi:hypothetical protein
MAKKKKTERFMCVERTFHNGSLYAPEKVRADGMPVTYTREELGGTVTKHFRRVNEQGVLDETAEEAEERDAREMAAKHDAPAEEPEEKPADEGEKDVF